LFFSGEVGRSIILVFAGVLAIGLVDNVLRPLLVGRDTEIPDFVVLIATVGGLTMLGVSGFVIGPILASLFVTLWGMLEKFRNELATDGAGDLDGLPLRLP
jgi:predicted PurR-regulated permease PerM